MSTNAPPVAQPITPVNIPPQNMDKALPRCTSACARRCSDIPQKRINEIAAMISGILFWQGWWILIDMAVMHPAFMREHKTYHIPGVAGSLAMLVVNIVPLRVVRREYGSWSIAATMILFFGLVMAFGGLIGGTYILVHDFLLELEENLWPGFAIFFQNLLIFLANMIAKFGTKPLSITF